MILCFMTGIIPLYAKNTILSAGGEETIGFPSISVQAPAMEPIRTLWMIILIAAYI